jgi:hypothetical protein
MNILRHKMSQNLHYCLLSINELNSGDYNYKGAKVKFIVEEATKDQKESRCLALLFLYQ